MSNNDDAQPSRPIDIRSPHSNSHPRHRSASTSSIDSSTSPSLQTPITPYSLTNPPPKISSSPTVSTSPILSYFFPTTPLSKQPPSRPFASPTVFEDVEDDPSSPLESEGNNLSRSFSQNNGGAATFGPSSSPGHARRMSTGFSTVGPGTRFGMQAPPPPITEAQHERGAGLFRRLSLGNAFIRPTVPSLATAPSQLPRSHTPPSSAPPVSSPRSPRKARRSTESRTRRAPSPMGERILKGHFDGFN